MKIKMLVMDVDGTLTDGVIYTGASGEEFKAFSVKDGYAIAHILPARGIIPVIITGRRSDIVSFRAGELGITEVHQGCGDKVSVLRMILEKYGISADEAAYIGDDVNDLECMKACGFCGCPADSVSSVRNAADYVCALKGGRGAVREFIEYFISIGK